MGNATPFHIRRHVHPAARPQTTPPARPETGIDYLSLLEATHTAAHAAGINYLAIADPHHHEGTDDGDYEDQR